MDQVQEQVLRWRVEAEGAPQVLAGLDAALQVNRRSVDQLRAAQQAKTISDQDAAEQMRLLAREYVNLQAQQGAVASGLQAAAGPTRNLGLAFNALAQGAEDMQFSVAGGMNNMGQFVQLMGGPGGAVAVVTLLGVAINQLVKHWPDLVALFDSTMVKAFTDEVTTLKDRIKELEHNPGRIVVESVELETARQRYDDLTKAKHAFDAFMNKRTPEQESSARAFQDALVAAPGGPQGVAEKIEQGFVADLQVQNAGRRKKLQDAMAKVDQKIQFLATQLPFTKEDLEKATKEQGKFIEELNQLTKNERDQAHEATEKVVGEAVQGQGDAQERVVESMRKAGADQALIDQVKAAHPDVVQTPAMKQEAERLERERKKKEQEAARAAEKAARERERETDALNKQGIENQHAAEMEAERQRDKDARDAEQAREKADREQQQRVSDLARRNAVAVEGRDQDLTRSVNTRLGAGDDPEAIVKRLAPQAGQRLGQVPGMDPALIAAVAEKVIRDVIERQGPKLVAEGGGAAGAAALNADIAGRNFDASNRGVDADRRRRQTIREQALADQFRAYGRGVNQMPTDDQAEAMARATIKFMDRDRFNFQEATARAWNDMLQEVRRAQFGGGAPGPGRRPHAAPPGAGGFKSVPPTEPPPGAGGFRSVPATDPDEADDAGDAAGHDEVHRANGAALDQSVRLGAANAGALRGVAELAAQTAGRLRGLEQYVKNIDRFVQEVAARSGRRPGGNARPARLG